MLNKTHVSLSLAISMNMDALPPIEELEKQFYQLEGKLQDLEEKAQKKKSFIE